MNNKICPPQEKVSFILYVEYKKHLELLSNKQIGELLMALFKYAECGRIVELDGMTRMAFSFIKNQMDRDCEKWETTKKMRSEAGRKGGLSRWKKTSEGESDDIKNECWTEESETDGEETDDNGMDEYEADEYETDSRQTDRDGTFVKETKKDRTVGKGTSRAETDDKKTGNKKVSKTATDKLVASEKEKSKDKKSDGEKQNIAKATDARKKKAKESVYVNENVNVNVYENENDYIKRLSPDVLKAFNEFIDMRKWG